MADNSISEQIALKMGLDLSPLKATASELKSILGDLLASGKQNVEQAKQMTAQQKEGLAQLKTQADSVLVASRQQLAAEQQKQAAFKTQTAEMLLQSAEQKVQLSLADAKKAAIQVETAEHVKLLTQRRAETAELQKQIAMLRLQATEEAQQHRERGREGGGREGGGALASILPAVLGRGIVGGIAGGVLAGEGIKAAIEGVARFIEKLKEMQEESSKLSLVQDRFEKLAKGAGVDGVEMMEKLHEATEGLVSKLTLASFGAHALQSNIKSLTPDKIVELTAAVVKLAESAGKMGPEQAISRVSTALSRGGQRLPMILAQITGLTAAQLRIANLSPVLNRVERDTEAVAHAIAVVVSEAAKLGEVPRTLAQAATQVSVLSKDLLLSFGKGFGESPGMQALFKLISDAASRLSTLNEQVESFGVSFGNAIGTIGLIAKNTVPTIEALFTVISDLVGIAGRMTGVVGPMEELQKTGDSATEAFKKAHPYIEALTSGIIDFNAQMQIMLLGLHKVLDAVKEVVNYLPAPIRNTIAGAAAGAIAGSVVPVVGTGYGALAGAAGAALNEAGKGTASLRDRY